MVPKRRKDEDYDVHTVVEATYDRVLKQRELHEKGFNYDDSTLNHCVNCRLNYCLVMI